MNDEVGKPLCDAQSHGRWVRVVTYDDTGGRGTPQEAALLFKTAAEARECARRLNAPWGGD
jgi:hypothetical protein